MKKNQKSILRQSSGQEIKNQKFQGFTLIELLVVIVIIGVMTSFLMTNYIGVRIRSRDVQRKSDLRQIQSALEMYRSDVGMYPDTVSFVCDNSITSGGVIYMQRIPCDPINSGQLVYKYARAGGVSGLLYTLAVCLENVNDQQRDSNPPFSVVPNPLQVDGSQSITSCVGGTTNWSYTLYSP
ncbi:prepilin-type N-terminal cleavage/methylation domain-containing protein [Patescibacteria group bacterium]|nr:prepilin-type N-terminal cleavage/methylation domain-containing protein [Patescibacteria group bacterium]